MNTINSDKIRVERLLFTDIFDIAEIQRFQNLFSDAHNVASIIIASDNKAITKPSNYCSFCSTLIENKKSFSEKCCLFHNVLHRFGSNGSITNSWLGDGFLEAHAGIYVADVHFASWIIGPVRIKDFDGLQIKQYAARLGIKENEFRTAVQKIPMIGYVQFERILKMLSAFINEISEKAYNNLKLEEQIEKREHEQLILKESEEKYRLLFDNNPQPMWIYESNTLRFLEVNRAATHLYGYSVEEFMEMTIKEIRSPKDVKVLLSSLLSKSEDKLRCGEWRHQKKNGEKLLVEITSQPILYKNMKARLVIIHDMTERKKMEAALEDNKIQLQTLIKTIPDLIWLKNTEGVYLTCNTMFERFFGAFESEITGKTDYDFVNKELADFFRENDKRAIQAGIPTSNEEWVTFADDGHRALLDVIKTPMFDLEGNLIGVLGIGRDITEKRKADEELMQVNSELTSLMDNLDKAVFSLDTLHNRMLRVSQAHQTLFGYPQDEFFRNPRLWYELIVPDDKPKIDAGYSVLREGKNLVHEFRINHSSGETRWIEAKINPVLSSMGELIRLDGIASDITERKQTEQELIAAKDKAEESDRLKSAFLANMSHEVRTPLNSIIGFSELLKDSDFDEDEKDDFINQIILNGNHLLSIISDIMDISKLESSELKIYPRVFEILPVLSRIEKEFLKRIEKKGLFFKLELPLTIESCTVFADQDRLIQIFNNLLDNSIKFTERGGIEVGCLIKPKTIQFFIKDSGIGIPREFHEVIFERFRQVELSNSRRFGGNGLGLAISKKLVEQMGGSIWMESTVAGGTTFFFTLPAVE